MLATMSQTTKNAPFGTDDTPNLEMKIIGGKRVHIPADRNKSNETLGHQSQQWPPPRPGPHGTPSILTQPNWDAYDSGMRTGFSMTERNNATRKISSYTSPMGDRSYSFKHGLPDLNTKAVLPPIATQPAGSHTYHHDYYYDSNNDATTTTLEEQVGRQLKAFGSQKLKDMYIDLTTFDRNLTGMIGEAQFSLVALRHNLPLKLSLLKIIFAKFVDIQDPLLINYEKVLQFLSDCASQFSKSKSARNIEELYRSKTTPPDLSPRQTINNIRLSNSYNFDESTLQESPKIHDQVPPVDGNLSPLRKEEEDKLLGLIMGQLSPEESMDLGELRTCLNELDKLQSGQLPMHVINSTCIKCRIPLTSSILTKLFSRAETSGGMVDYNFFLQPLEKVQNLRNGQAGVRKDPQVSPKWGGNLQHQPLSSKSRHSVDPSVFLKTGISSSPAPKQLPWEKKPLGGIGVDIPPLGNFDEAPFPVSPVSTASSDGASRVNLPEGWDEREFLQRDDVYISPRNAEPWLTKFNKLAHALRTYHPENSEILDREEAERVTKNYNLIYGLGFSEKKIENAVQQSLLPRKDGSAGVHISVNALLGLLEGKKRLLI